MTKPVAVQLYSLREEMEHDFENVLREISAIGYAGVETAAIPESTAPDKAGRLMDDLGLKDSRGAGLQVDRQRRR